MSANTFAKFVPSPIWYAAAGCQRSFASWMLFLPPLSSCFQLPCAEPGVLISNAVKENMNNLQFMIKH